MAPKRNRAKPQRGSFLTRGREQVRQRQQTRQQASRQLPPEGGTSAGSLKARGQRTATAVQQKVQRDIATTRALADMMQRNKARADRQIPADTSPSVRRVGPGGANPKPQGQLPPGQRGGDMRQKGGPLAIRQSSAMTERSREVSRGNNGGPVRPVQVRDMGSPNRPQMSPGQQRALPQSQPSARRQAAQAKADAAARGSQGPNRVGQPAGSANRMYGANVVDAAVGRAQRQAQIRNLTAKGTVATAVVGSLMNLPEEVRKAQRLIKDPKGAVQDVLDNQGITQFRAKDRPAPKKPSRPERQGPTVPARILAAGGGSSNRASATTRSGSGSGSPTRSTSGSGASGGSRGPSTQSGGGSTQSRSASPSRSSSAPSAPFKGTVDEGRMIWAQKYSSDKYKGQAINDEAKKLLEKLKVKKGDGQSAANKAGWDGNKNY